MLGKRCRTIHRTASISHNMGPSLHDFHHHDLQAPSADELIHQFPIIMKPQGPAIFPQIIGFNPIIKATESPQIRPVCRQLHHHDQVKPAVGTSNDNNYQQQMPRPSNRSPISPRSALQTLLDAARQINYAESNYTNDNTNLPLMQGANCSQAAPSPICATQGLMQGLNGYSTVINASKSAQSKEINHDYMKEREIKAAPEHNMMNDHVMNDREGAASLVESQISSSLEEHDCRYLYLATSPLTDFNPNMAPSINFLESCYLCKRPLGNGLDIFIYRGDTAFCSEECRYQKMVMDERKERYINTNNSPSNNKLSHMQYAGQYNNHNHRSLVMPAA